MNINKEHILAGLTEVWSAWGSFGADLTTAQWATPSRCPGWTVQDNLAHLVGTERMLSGHPAPEGDPGGDHVLNPLAAGNEKWVDSLRAISGPEVLAAFQEISASRLATLNAMSDEEFVAVGWTPIGESPYGRFMQIRVYDAWLHLQDCREPLGLPGDESGLVAEISVDEVGSAMGFIIGKKGGAPDGSRIEVTLTGPIERTLRVEVDGRAKAVEVLSGPPTATLAMTSTDFLALTGGRHAGAPFIAEGRVTLGGDEILARQLAERLAFTM